MEYACFVWSPTADISPHARKQRKALALCLGLPQTVGREAMEVASGTLPMDLRFEETQVRELCKLMAKNVTKPVKKQLVKSLEN